ncbi:MAG: polysaccharide biosynthesis tyrosine autokinase [Pseudomonadota bacterium]
MQGQDIDASLASNQVYDYLSTQVEIIRSRKLALSVAENLKLGERYDVLGNEIDDSRPPNLTNEEWLTEKRAIAATYISSAVLAEVPSDSWVITIAYQDADPVLAAELANGYAEAFANTDTEVSVSINQYAQRVLQNEIASLREKVKDAEEAVNNYARDSGIIVQQASQGGDTTGPGATLTGTNLANINQRVAQARTARIEAEQRWQSIQNLPAAQLPEVQESTVLQNLVSEKIAKQTELIDLRQRYDDTFPQIANLVAQIDALTKQIEASSANIKATVRNDFIVARNQERALDAELASLTSQTLAEQDKQVQFGVLEREAQALRNQLGVLLDRFNQISSAANVETGSITKLDAALVPDTAYSPSLVRNMSLALVFGFALAGGLAVIRETFDDRIRSLDEVEQKLGLPLIGHTPFVDEKDIESEGTNRFSALMEAYAAIRSTIEFAMPHENCVIQLTSSQASEGKSTTAVILAELFASMGRKTLLIDGDLRRPSVGQLLDIDRPNGGLIEVLLGDCELNTALVSGVHENLDILPIDELPPNPTEVLASPQLRDFIEASRQEYSLIIFDSCPIMGLADAPVLASLVDRTIFVLEANKVQFGQTRAALRRMRYAGAQIMGVVLTKYRALEAGQTYDYQYRYYQYGAEQD